MDSHRLVDTVFRILIGALLGLCILCLVMGVRAATAAGDQRAIAETNSIHSLALACL